MTTYSYKPASGLLEGASTVVPLKTGEFLEVRRGEKTRWRRSETRQRWPSLEAWKATLPADAVVVENTSPGTAGPLVPESGWSADFKTAYNLMKSVSGREPVGAYVHIKSNATDAEKYLKLKRRAEKQVHIRGGPTTYVGKHHLSLAAQYDAMAQSILAQTPYEYRLCRSYNPVCYSSTLKAQRISDGEFVPLFFDTRRGVLHIPTLDKKVATGLDMDKEGTSFAAIGVRPVFLIPTGRGISSIRMVSLEGSAAATGTE